jgi:transposase
MSRRNITDEFKAEAVQLVVAQGYSFAKASEALGVGDTALRRWVARWRVEQVWVARKQYLCCRNRACPNRFSQNERGSLRSARRPALANGLNSINKLSRKLNGKCGTRIQT